MNQQVKKIVIIGGVAGGASAAARARRHSETASITLIERGPDVSFANCGLPYYIGGEISERADLAVQTPQSLRNLLNLTVKVRTEAVHIDRDSRQVTLRNLENGEEEFISYDELILAPGASPLRPPLPGIDNPRVLTLRNLQDMDHIKVAAEKANQILVIGAGFIGLEMAEQLVHLGKSVTLIERNAQVLPQMDKEMTKQLETCLKDRGVTLVFQDGIAAFNEEADHISAILASGASHKADLVILSIGVKPESQLAREAGIDLNARGHIIVNSWQQTSDPHIYAVGDVCETADPIMQTRAAIPLGGPANRQGRTSADHIFLGDKALPYPGSIGTAIVRVFDHVAGLTGWTESRLKEAAIAYQSVTVNASSHASYYPSSETVTLKILWSSVDGRILGAQAIGKDGIDKRLDVIATAIRGQLTIDDLAHLELAYAPPFGSAKDVLNIAGVAAGNVRDGFLVPIATLADAGDQIIDVRPAVVSSSNPVPGAKNIPLAQLRSRLTEIDKTKPVFTICQMGKTSYFAARILANNGFDARSILGGAHHQI